MTGYRQLQSLAALRGSGIMSWARAARALLSAAGAGRGAVVGGHKVCRDHIDASRHRRI